MSPRRLPVLLLVLLFTTTTALGCTVRRSGSRGSSGNDDDSAGDDDDATGLSGSWSGTTTGTFETSIVTLPCTGIVNVQVSAGLASGTLSCDVSEPTEVPCAASFVEVPLGTTSTIDFDECPLLYATAEFLIEPDGAGLSCSTSHYDAPGDSLMSIECTASPNP